MTDPLRRLDDPDFPALTMSQAAELLGSRRRSCAAWTAPACCGRTVRPAGTAATPAASCAGRRVRELLDAGHPLASAELIVGLQDQLPTPAPMPSGCERHRTAPRGWYPGSMTPRWTTADIPDQTGRTVVVTGANSGLGLVDRAGARRGPVRGWCWPCRDADTRRSRPRPTIAGDVEVRAARPGRPRPRCAPSPATGPARSTCWSTTPGSWRCRAGDRRRLRDASSAPTTSATSR